MNPRHARQISRPLLDRLTRIDAKLQAKRFPNCSTLARDLGVSVKTIQRDLDFMLDRQNLPLAYDRAKHGYYYTEPVLGFSAVQMSEGEVVAMLVAQKALEQYRGTPFEHVLEHAFSKIAATLKDTITFDPSAVLAGVSFKSIGTTKADLLGFKLLSQAQQSAREVTFRYLKPHAESSERRTVHPYNLACMQNLWYLLAYDPTRKAYRTFALPRMSEIAIGQASFARRADFSVDAVLGGAFGVMSGGKRDVRVRIDFDRFAAAYIRERTWHRSQQLRPRGNGSLRFTVVVPRLEEIRAWVLSWGGHATVVSPEELRVAVRDSARRAMLNNRGCKADSRSSRRGIAKRRTS